MVIIILFLLDLKGRGMAYRRYQTDCFLTMEL